MNLRKLVASALAGGALLIGGAAFLNSSASAASQPISDPIVRVDTDGSDGSIGVYTGIPGQPLWSVWTGPDGICAGFSYQVPQCIGVTIATDLP